MKFGQIIGFANEAIAAGRLGARAQLRHGRGARRLRARLCVLRGRACRSTSCRSREQRDVPGLPPRQRQGRHAQLCRHPDLGELLDHGRRLHRQGDRALGHPRRLSQHRRHRGAQAGQWLRHRLSRRDLRHAEEDHLGLCHQPEHGRRHHGRPRLRGLPDPALQGSLRRHRERDVPHHDDPGDRRHAERPSRPASRRCKAMLPIVNAARRETRAGVGTDAGAAVRRLGRLFRHHRQPGARRRGRHPGAPRRHGDPVGDAGDLRRRAPADPARRDAARSARSWSTSSTGGRTTPPATTWR